MNDFADYHQWWLNTVRKAFLVGVINQSHHCIYSQVFSKGIATRKISRFYVRVFQDLVHAYSNKNVETKGELLKWLFITFYSNYIHWFCHYWLPRVPVQHGGFCPRYVFNQRVCFLTRYLVGFSQENFTIYCRNSYPLILGRRTPSYLLPIFCY